MYNPRSLDILARRKDSFVLWMPNSPSTLAGDPPVLVLRKVTNRTLPPFDQNIRFFADVVMAFGHDPYRYISFDQFHLRPSQEPENPDSYQSHSMGNLRDGWGGESWRYICTTETYDPESGRRGLVHPSWSFHHAHLVRWMTDFGAVNYITSHDIAGYRKERLYDFLVENGVWDVGKRAKLAFVLLLTSVGIPMIFAGEEFADRMDVSLDINKKQTDPVNYERKNDDGWRQSLFTYVSSLVKFRQACPGLGENDTDFFHVDQTRGGRIMAWRRGADTPGNEYVVPNWPEENMRGWKEITQGRIIPPEWVGREPLYAWEAKVYTRWQQDEESLIQ
ncbi:glycoside hydrolase family 13 protein [Thozetella sp. PMI_491]|nr:glycoside hydrolase family 13 protein [Thozetella sp. PMI_491]